MKKLTQLTLVLLTMVVAFAGCDAAKDAASEAAGTVTDQVADLAKLEGLGDFDLGGLKDKFAGVTEGLSGVTEENVDGLTSKITELTGSLDGIDKLTGPAKTAASGMFGTFTTEVKAAMEKMDEGILSKLKPVIEPLLEKLASFG